MNENNVAGNEVVIEIGSIKHPKFGTIFEGAKINIKLTDKAYELECTTHLQALEQLIPVGMSFLQAAFSQACSERKERREACEKENAARIADWELRTKEYEERLSNFKKAYAKWEKEIAQAKEGDRFKLNEPTFHEHRPERPNCSCC